MSKKMPKEVDWKLVKGMLKKVRRALREITRRFRRVPDVDSFLTSRGQERRDSICMLFIAVGESFRQIDDRTNKTFLPLYPDIVWKDVIGFRNI